MSMMAASNISLGEHFLGALGAAHPVHRVTGVGEPQLDAAGHHHVVFNQEESHGLSIARASDVTGALHSTWLRRERAREGRPQ